MINYNAIFSIVAFRFKDFFSEYQYSILAPITTNILFLIVFVTIEGKYSLSIENISFVKFIAPGLIIMIVAQESYDNTSVSLINMKQIGSFNDWLIAPISRIEILISFILSSILIGFTIALINVIIFAYIINIEIINYIYFIYYLLIVILFFSCLGCLVGVISSTWDTQSSFSNFFVTPLNFLSGTFFSIEYLADNLKFLLYYNPYYYLVSSFRNCFNDQFNFNLLQNMYTLFFTLLCFVFTAYVYIRGIKIIK
tara:strand:+ start:634 stop:1395 length:762 start_codon:yes stop_codon:yes gene_type:complete